MKSEVIKAGYLKTIAWVDDKIIDWANAGTIYSTIATNGQLGRYHYGFNFDGAVTSVDNQYALIYQRVGTKALLLKNGELIREINRSYYCANSYEYPAVFADIDDVTYLIHCPLRYNRLDFENLETGKIITKGRVRKPWDTFHSRLEISPDGNFLMSKGWYWHPRDIVEVFNLRECIKNPRLLDKSNIYPEMGVEICTASFINNTLVLIGTTDEVFDNEAPELYPKHVAIWDIGTGKISNHVKVKAEFGNLFVINDHYAWDLYKYPKIINISTGDVIEEDKTIDSGTQNSSIIGNSAPQIIYNRRTKQIAISREEAIEILTPDIDWKA